MATYDVNQSAPTIGTGRFGRQFSVSQMSVLNRSLLVAGIGFICIGILGFIVSWILVHVILPNKQSGVLLGLYLAFIVLIIVSQFMAAFAFGRIETLSKTRIATIFSLYGIGQGIGFGILFAALELQFASATTGISYIILAFASGGLAFITASYIGKRMTLKSTMTLSTYLKYLSIGFLMIMLLWFAMSIIAVFTNGFGINLDYMYCLILGFGTLLFFLYTIFDFSVISKMSPFLSVQDSSIVANYVWMFGFKLLIDLVMMVWYILLIIARFSR